MKSEIERLTSLLQRTFEKNAWHGPAVKEVLEGITGEQALKRIGTTHSIIELVAHMTSWRIFVIRKLQGEDDYKVTDELNFPETTDWPRALRELDESQEKLLEAIRAFPEEKLGELVPHNTYRYTYYTLIHGILHHDLYHTGQLSLIKRAVL
jgi:uncharacterized damage-inducible protein DinB